VFKSFRSTPTGVVLSNYILLKRLMPVEDSLI